MMNKIALLKRQVISAQNKIKLTSSVKKLDMAQLCTNTRLSNIIGERYSVTSAWMSTLSRYIKNMIPKCQYHPVHIICGIQKRLCGTLSQLIEEYIADFAEPFFLIGNHTQKRLSRSNICYKHLTKEEEKRIAALYQNNRNTQVIIHYIVNNQIKQLEVFTDHERVLPYQTQYLQDEQFNLMQVIASHLSACIRYAQHSSLVSETRERICCMSRAKNRAEEQECFFKSAVRRERNNRQQQEYNTVCSYIKNHAS